MPALSCAMPVTGTARDQYLTALATIINSGAARTPEAIEAAAHEVAHDLAGAHQLTEADLFEVTPRAWLTDPGGSGVAQEARALLAIAQPVLNVPMAVISPIATRGAANAREADLRIVFTRSDAVKSNPRPPEFLEEVELQHVNVADLMKKLDALFAHPRFADLYGVRDARAHAAFFQRASRTIAGVVEDLQRKGQPAPTVLAGGVPVSGPEYEARMVPVGSIFAFEPKMSLIALAYAGLRAMLVLDHLDEPTLRGAIGGRPTQLVSGQRPRDLFVLRGVHGEPAGNLAVTFDEAVQRKFHPAPDGKQDVAARLADALKTALDDFARLADAWVPYALVYDQNARASSLVAERLKAREQTG